MNLRGKLRRGEFDLSNTRRTDALLLQRKRSQYLSAQESEKVTGFHQLASADLRGRVMNPNPEAIFDPLQVEFREVSGCLVKCGGQSTVALKQHRGVLDPFAGIFETDEL